MGSYNLKFLDISSCRLTEEDSKCIVKSMRKAIEGKGAVLSMIEVLGVSDLSLKCEDSKSDFIAVSAAGNACVKKVANVLLQEKVCLKLFDCGGNDITDDGPVAIAEYVDKCGEKLRKLVCPTTTSLIMVTVALSMPLLRWKSLVP